MARKPRKPKTTQPDNPGDEFKPSSASALVQTKLVHTAVEKIRRDEVPTDRELRALRSWEKQQDVRLRDYHYRSVPKQTYKQWAGTDRPMQDKILDEQIERYGIPYDQLQRQFKLPDVIHWLHRFLAANARKLMKADDEDDPLLSGSNSPGLESYRMERAKIAALERQQLERTLVSVDTLHDLFVRLGELMRSAGEDLQRQFGPEAADVLNEVLDDWDRELEALERFQPQSASETKQTGTRAGRRTKRTQRKAGVT